MHEAGYILDERLEEEIGLMPGLLAVGLAHVVVVQDQGVQPKSINHLIHL